jgi:L-threonylcarbamoyladenylate synthase
MIEITPDAIAKAVRTLDKGGLVVMPTDTVYGLAAAADDRAALEKLFAAKGRPEDKPLVVVVADLRAAKRLVEFSEAAQRLAEAFWPGPLTLVLPWQPTFSISTAVTAGKPTIGLRIPNHPAALAILRAFGRPLVLTSANPTGGESAVEAWEIEAELGKQADLVLDGGTSPIGVHSTVLEVTERGLRLLRPGALEVKEIANALAIDLAAIAQPASEEAP